MTIAYVGNGGWRGQSGGLITPLVPTGSVGDFLILMVLSDSTTSVTGVAGWNTVGAVTGGSLNTASLTVFSRTATPSEPTTYTVNLSKAGMAEACILRYSGTTVSVDAIATIVNGSSTSVLIPSISPTQAPAMMVMCAGAFTTNFDKHFTQPTGTTLRTDGPFYNLAGGAFDKTLSSGGVTSVPAATLSQAGPSVVVAFDLIDSSSTPVGGGGGGSSSTKELAVFSKSGALAATTGAGRFRFPFAATILGISAAVNTAPTGAAITLNVKRNGTSIFSTTPLPTIAVNTNATASEVVPDVTAISAGDYLTVDITQVGNSIPGSDLTVFVHYSA